MLLQLGGHPTGSFIRIRNLRLAIAGTAAVTIALGIGRFAYTPILPLMQDDLMLSSTNLGALASWNFFGYLVGSFLPIVSKNLFEKERLIFFLMLGLSILTTGLMGCTDKMVVMVPIRFFAGISSALTLILGTGLIFKKFDITGTSLLKLAHFCGFGLGISISAIVVSIASNFGFTWSLLWVLLASLCCVLAIPVILYIPKETLVAEITNEDVGNNNRSVLAFIFVALGYGLFGLGYIIFGTFISALVVNLAHLASFEKFAWLIVGIAAMPSVFLWQKLSMHIGKDLALALACISSAIGIFFATTFVSVVSLSLGCILYGAAMPGIVALALLEGKDRYGGSITSAVAILTLAFSFGQMIGPLLAGFLIDRVGDYLLAMQLSVFAFFFAGVFMIHPNRVLRYFT